MSEKPKRDRKKRRRKGVRGLSERQKRFILEYLKDENVTQAAIRAGYARKSANRSGLRVYQIPEVKEAIEKELTERARRLRVDADWVLERLKIIADANLLDYVKRNEKGVVEVDLSNITREQAEAISSIRIDNYPGGRQRIRFTLVDKLATLRDIGRHVAVGAFEHRVKVLGDSLADHLDALDREGSTAGETEPEPGGGIG